MPYIEKSYNKKVITKKENKDNKYYNAYRPLREAYLREHPLCEECLAKGKVVPAVEIHHIRPFLTGRDENERMDLATDYNNLIALCRECHQAAHGKKKRERNWL